MSRNLLRLQNPPTEKENHPMNDYTTTGTTRTRATLGEVIAYCDRLSDSLGAVALSQEGRASEVEARTYLAALIEQRDREERLKVERINRWEAQAERAAQRDAARDAKHLRIVQERADRYAMLSANHDER